MSTQTTQTIRERVKARRALLSPEDAQSDSRLICDRLLIYPDFDRWQHIGIYLAVRNEVDLSSFIDECVRQNKTLYAPKLQAHGTMQFHLFTSIAETIENQYGIREPVSPVAHSVESLDALIVPGVCFDTEGHRIGMGGGYYDKLLHYKREKPYSKPYLMGVAYDFQKLEHITPNPWDVKMDDVIFK